MQFINDGAESFCAATTKVGMKVKVKVKQSSYRPGVAQRVPGS
jgi:hypothetical protein